MNYYKRHIGDYAKEAGHLNMLEHGAYNLLKDYYYSTEKSILNNNNLYKSVRATSEEEKAAVDYVLSTFYVLKKNAWFNKNFDEDLKKTKKKISTAKKNGEMGGREKWKSVTTNEHHFDEKLEEKNAKTLKAIAGVASEGTNNEPTRLAKRPDSVSNENNLIQKVETERLATHYPLTTTHYPLVNKTVNNDPATNEICVALKLQGVDLVSFHNSKLHDLVKKGATIADFIDASKIAKERGKGVAYLLGIVERKNEKVVKKFGHHHKINCKKNMDEGVNEDGSF